MTTTSTSGPRAMDFLRKHEVWVFLFGIVILNALFIAAIDAGWLPRGLYNMGRFLLLGSFLILIVFLARQARGVWALLKPMTVWRVSPMWFILAAGWGALNCILVLFFKGIILGTGISEIQASFELVSRPRLMQVIIISSFIGEIVWIGYAVQKLSERFTPFVSALIVGLFWTAWWTPMVYVQMGIVPGLPLGGLLFNQTGIAIMCAFFYARTGSALVVLTMQVFFNSSILVFPVAPTTGGIETYWGFALFYFSVSAVFFATFGPKPLLSKR
ncbi:type II CAAX prenyl endopeptidase Rce1 family protein [Aliiroseovarius sp. 2305UL8-7]|uniref:CPBP family glutamic-type intramembrane protease n=1 Tax=Aliiroseovarius conchicola TaxID=3121637 RepID=UPI0035293DE1